MSSLDWLPWVGNDSVEQTAQLDEVPRALIATAVEDVLNESDEVAELLDEIEQVDDYKPGTRGLEHLAIILTAQVIAMRQDERLRPHAEEFLHQAMALFVDESLADEFKTVDRVEQFHDIQSRRFEQHWSLFQDYAENEGNIGRAESPIDGLSFKGKSLLIAYMGEQYRMYRENFDAWTIE